MNKLLGVKPIIFIIILFFCLYFSNISYASVEKIQISRGQVVTQQVNLAPGFAVLFEVPMDIVSFSIADPTAITCTNMPPTNNRLLCKPLTMQEYSTNLVMATENNEFNIILKVANDGKKNAFKYVFYDQSQKPPKITNYTDFAKSNVQNNIIDVLLNDYSNQSCHFRSKNNYAEIRCLEKIKFGTNSYLKFKIISKSKTAFDIVKCDLIVQTLGGFTGLSIKNETPSGSEQIIKSKNLRYNEETIGIIKMPNISVNKDQRLVLVVYTSIGSRGDLIMKVK